MLRGVVLGLKNFKISNGVKQGGVISPLLFSQYFDKF